MAKKVIKLTESDLTRIVKRVIEEQTKPNVDHAKMAEDLLKKGPKPTEPGAKYCFTKQTLINDIKNEGVQNTMLYKIKPGDSIGKLEEITMQERHMYKSNNLCNLKDKNGLRANDVVVMSMLPSM